MFQKIKQICRAVWAIIRARDLDTIVIITPGRDFQQRVQQIQDECRFTHVNEVYNFSIQILEWTTDKIRGGKYILASNNKGQKKEGSVLYYECFKHIPNSPYKRDPAFLHDDPPDWEDYINEHIEKPKE